MKKFKLAYKRLREAQIAVSNAIAIDFPIGSLVFYEHGDYVRQGRVIMHGEENVCIKTPNQHKIWIHAPRIKRVMFDVPCASGRGGENETRNSKIMEQRSKTV